MAVDMRRKQGTYRDEDIYTQPGMPRSSLRHRPMQKGENVTVLTPRASRQSDPQGGSYRNGESQANHSRRDPYPIGRHTDSQRQTHPHIRDGRRASHLPDTQQGFYGDEGYQEDPYENEGYQEESPRRDQRSVNRKRTSNAVAPSRQKQRTHQGTEQAHTHRRTIAVLMLGAIAALLLIMLANALISWWGGVMDNIHYGYPRVSQMDVVVGHNDSSTNETHIIFLNLHGHVQIIEIPGGDASHARIFTGPTLIGAGQDLIPITGEIRNEDGRRDLIVHIQDQQIVFINDGSTFHQQ